jgi:outer membrane protein assembly factor BamD
MFFSSFDQGFVGFFSGLSRKKIFASLMTLVLLFIMGCGSSDKVHDKPEDLFKEAEEFEKAERYEEAIKRYTELKNRFPYSNYSTKAKLKTGDCYFKQESYPEAQVAYQTFRELHPRHAQIDEVVYKIGLSYYKQLPDTIDRDLIVAKDAISHFDEILSNFRNSEYTKDARKYRESALVMLAEKEDYVGNFYFVRKNCLSALPRYMNLVDTYQNIGGKEAIALARTVICANRLGKVDLQNKYWAILKDKYSGSAEYNEAAVEVRK